VTDPSSQILATTSTTGPGNGGDPNKQANPTGNIDIFGDFHPAGADPNPTFGDGSAIVLRNGAVSQLGDSTGAITPGAGGGLTRVYGNGEADTIIFDQTILGGQTRAYGDGAVESPSCETAPRRWQACPRVCAPPRTSSVTTRSSSTACSRWSRPAPPSAPRTR
jgi:hypothetical protein